MYEPFNVGKNIKVDGRNVKIILAMAVLAIVLYKAFNILNNGI